MGQGPHLCDDLRSLTDTLTSELGAAAPALAVNRLLRFIATHELVCSNASMIPRAVFKTSITRRSRRSATWPRD